MYTQIKVLFKLTTMVNAVFTFIFNIKVKTITNFLILIKAAWMR